MKKNHTQILDVPVEQLIKADWNYKTEGTNEQIQKLISSIEKDKSIGVLAVREVVIDGKNLLEVIDGNHRLEAIKQMDWKVAPVENFGEISTATAATIARRRNHTWFDDDIIKLEALYNDHIFKEFSKENLLTFMPDSAQFLDSMSELNQIDWTNTDQASVKSGEINEIDGFTTISFSLPNEVLSLWNDLKDRYKEMIGEEQQDYRAFEFAIIEALNSTKNNELK